MNCIFELSGAFFLVPSIIKAYKEKVIQGVSILTPLFFCSWGFWNVFYYPSLDQWWSMSAAMCLCWMNMIWLGQVYFYSKKGN